MPAVYAAAASLAPPNSQLPQLLSHPTLPFVAMGPDHHAKEIGIATKKKNTKCSQKEEGRFNCGGGMDLFSGIIVCHHEK